MVSHRDQQAKREKSLLEKHNERQLNEREEIQATYDRWSDQGRECESLKQSCTFCSMAQYGFSKYASGNKRCWQPEANEQLKEREIVA